MSSYGLVLGAGVSAAYPTNSRQEVTLTPDGSLRVAVTSGGAGGGSSGTSSTVTLASNGSTATVAYVGLSAGGTVAIAGVVSTTPSGLGTQAVSVSNFPSLTTITGSVTTTPSAGSTQGVSGTLAVTNAGSTTLSIGGAVTVSNTGTNPLVVGGTLALANGGTVAVSNAGTSLLSVGGTVALSAGSSVAVSNAGTNPLSVTGTLALAANTAVTSTPASVTNAGNILNLTSVGNTFSVLSGGYGALSTYIKGLSGSGASVQFQATDNGTDFYVVGAITGAANSRVTTATADGSYSFSSSGRQQIRLYVSVVGTGSATVGFTQAPEARIVTLDSSPTGPLYVSTTPASAGPGTDTSSNRPGTLASTLATGTVLNPGCLYVQNQSAAAVQLWLGAAPGAAGATPILIAAGAGANTQGGDWQAASNAPWFTGTFTVLGAAGAQVGVRSN